MDCCHSGTVADLPYKIGANDSAFEIEKGFNTETYEEIKKKDMIASGELDKDGNKPSEEDEAPLPYRPEDGFVVRPNERPRGVQTQQRPKQDLPPPPPQCCTIL